MLSMRQKLDLSKILAILVILFGILLVILIAEIIRII